MWECPEISGSLTAGKKLNSLNQEGVFLGLRGGRRPELFEEDPEDRDRFRPLPDFPEDPEPRGRLPRSSLGPRVRLRWGALGVPSLGSMNISSSGHSTGICVFRASSILSRWRA